MADLSVKIHDLLLKNPVMLASGTCGYAEEINEFYDVSQLGGIFLKGITPRNRDGNLYPRMAETPSGMLNAVGLQNKGIDYFIQNIYPRIKNYETPLIINVNGSTVEEYIEVTEKVNELDNIPAIELNISCPNVKEGGMAFGVSCPGAEAVTRAVRSAYNKTLIVKLSPNVTDVSEIAKAVEGQGADGVSLVNTFVGMAIDAETRKPLLSTVTGGLSGPAIKPIALRMVWQVAQAVKIPVIGMGGIMNAADAIEFLLAGASAVQVGTALFKDPFIPLNIVEGIDNYLLRHQMSSVSELIGGLQL
ncbi:dihydroorotate dehydrogenase [Mariniphaga sediminis]|jgi:dihydroorotate dehydrogenase (NAD+) catalytic subunit|uniref:Dihydroorotate dehydrogenase n=1 Tax=Mariniphaga sediminis TaxID=1628158 RepID=A0A399CV95_9BACT|nr:dihydroorotate dehydrogenase [Mariniphaga sediminis]RIH63183.1 dihydroorotate dehydrogenase [Mariniphaga sediminis]